MQFNSIILYIFQESNANMQILAWRFLMRAASFSHLMQCTGNSGCFPRGKASSHSAALPYFFCSLCAVFSCFHTTGWEAYSFKRQTDMGSLTCAKTWVRTVHTKGWGGGGVIQGSHRLSVTKFQDFSRTFPGPNMFFQGP